VVIGFHEIFPKNGTGNFKYLTGNYVELSGKLYLIGSHLFAIRNSPCTGLQPDAAGRKKMLMLWKSLTA
jgi:hypothetical protein